MKIAIFHNFMDNIGGAERVGLTLARELDADIYSPVFDMEKISKMGFSVRTHPLGWIPTNAPFRQQLALERFRQLRLDKQYDFFLIDGDWAVSGALHNKPNLWYVHSPIREIWDLYSYTRTNMVPFLFRPAFDCWVHLNRKLTSNYIKHVNILVCNSLNTQRRVHKYLHREAKIIYPPIETNRFSFNKTGDFWLSVNRLISHKRILMQIEAFRKLPQEKLVIIGSYEQSRHFRQYAKQVLESAPPNVEIKSWISFEELLSLYGNCRGFITTAHDEDFGMTAVEAMAAGKPVIAPNEGGYRETVIDGKTGILINNINSENLADTIKNFSDPGGFRYPCQVQAQKFSVERFITEMSQQIRESIS